MKSCSANQIARNCQDVSAGKERYDVVAQNRVTLAKLCAKYGPAKPRQNRTIKCNQAAKNVHASVVAHVVLEAISIEHTSKHPL